MSGAGKRTREAASRTTPQNKDNMVLVRGKMVDLETLNPKERRRVKNILSAQRSREKTKEHITKLEKRVADGEARIAGLVRENYALRSMLATFMSQAAKGSGAPAPTGAVGPAGVDATTAAVAAAAAATSASHAAPPSRPLPALASAVPASPACSPGGGGDRLPAASGVRAARMLRTKSHDAIKTETPSPMTKKAKRPRRPTRASARIRDAARASPNQLEDVAFSPAPPAAAALVRRPLSISLNKSITPAKDDITVTTPGAGDDKGAVKQITLISPEAFEGVPEPLSLMSNSGAFGSPMVTGSPALPHRPDSFLRMSGWAEESGEMPGKNVVGPSAASALDAPSSHLRNGSVETELTGGPSVASTVSDVVTGTVLKDACMSSPLISSQNWNL